MEKQDYQLTHKEEELMNLLWTQNRPMTSIEMLETSENRSWSTNYLHIMLRSLMKKGAIEVVGQKQYGTQYARQFFYMITREQYAAKLALGRCQDKDSVFKVTLALIEELDKADRASYIADLKELLQQLQTA